jgi:hypothetical protein
LIVLLAEEQQSKASLLALTHMIITTIDFEDIQENLPLSPDSQDLADYEEYCRRELPLLFRASLEERIQNESQPIEENIRNQLMDIIRDCQDRVSSRYRSSTGTSAGTPSRNPASSQSPTMGRDSRSDISMSVNARSQIPAIAPFFQPPPPQHHLQSRLEVSDLQDSVSKPPDRGDPSDSGYSSYESGIVSRGSSSSRDSSDDLSVPSSHPQPASELVPTHGQDAWDTETGLLEMSSGNGVMDPNQIGTFENLFDSSFDGQFDNSFDSSWYEPQLASGNSWDLYMDGIHLPSDNAF